MIPVSRLLAGLMAALLLMLSAAPMPAACHDAVGTMPMAMHHTAPTRPTAPPEHVCIGCALAADWLHTPLAPRMVATAPAPFAAIASLPLGQRYPPHLPPPRAPEAARA